MAGPRAEGGRRRRAAWPRATLAFGIAAVVLGLAVVAIRIGERRSPSTPEASVAARGPHPGPAPAAGPAEIYRSRCRPCHRLGGEGGIYGPDLDRAGRILDEAFVRAYVVAPSVLEPDARMPPTRGLTPAEVEALAAYVVSTARATAAGR